MADKVTETAPERIWLQISDEPEDCDEPFPESLEGVTWCQDSVLPCEVGYVRADLAGMSPAMLRVQKEWDRWCTCARDVVQHHEEEE